MIEATVLIAAWNASETIEQSIASALDQSQITAETIVVDDASNDQTAMRAEAAGARVFVLPANGGPSSARNRAIEASKGAWLAVLDADDTMVSSRLRRMIDLGTRMQADVVLGNFRRVTEDGTPVDAHPFLTGSAYDAPQTWLLEYYLEGNQVTPGSKPLGYLKPIFRQDFIKKTGVRYDTSLRNGEDFHFVLACLAAGGKVVFSPDADYLYTVRKGSISHRVDPAHLMALMAADRAFWDRYETVLSPQAKTLLASRATALHKLKVSEEVLQALKAKRFLNAFVELLCHPGVTSRVSRQLLEAIGNRTGGRF